MEGFRVNIEDDALVDALRETAASHGRSVEDEIAAIVRDHPSIKANAERARAGRDGNWVEELIRLGRGLDLHVPQSTTFVRYAPAYPEGMEPLPGETLVDHLTRVSRPGFELELERDRSPHEGPDL